MPSERGPRTPRVAPGPPPVRRGWGWVLLRGAEVLVPFAIVSYGADGAREGEGENEDILSWK